MKYHFYSLVKKLFYFCLPLLFVQNSFADIQLSIPYFSQTDSRWNNDIMEPSPYKVNSYGCAMTCIAMVYNYFGILSTEKSFNEFYTSDSNPKDLNIWLSKNGGYDSLGFLTSWNFLKYSNISEKGIELSQTSGDIETVKEEIKKGHPVIVQVFLGGVGYKWHWVLVTGFNETTFKINDPYFSDRKTLTIYNNEIYSLRSYKGLREGHNIALNKPVIVTTNGKNDEYGGSGNCPEDITDGSLDYEPVSSSSSDDGCFAYVNGDYDELMEFNVTINLQNNYKISSIRYNMGNVQRAETWNADLMTTPFETSSTIAGSPYKGAWTEHFGSVNLTEVNVILQKTRISWATDWLFIGEIEIYGNLYDDTQVSNAENIPSKYFINHNYPNPFNIYTNIDFFIAQSKDINISVFNINGQLIDVIANQGFASGNHKIVWNAKKHSAGVYFIKFQSDCFQEIQKCILLK